MPDHLAVRGRVGRAFVGDEAGECVVVGDEEGGLPDTVSPTVRESGCLSAVREVLPGLSLVGALKYLDLLSLNTSTF